MKKIAVIGTVGIPACYGGFESLVESLTLNKSDDYTYAVFCSGKVYPEQVSEHNNAELIYLPLNANGIQSIPYDILSLIKCWSLKPDAVLILGVSGCMFLPLFKLFSKSKVITNIDGLEWKRDKWGKWAKKFLKWSESIAVAYSDVVVTDNKAIGDYVEAEYGIKSVTIAYGGDHAIRSLEVESLAGEYSLGLCRIEPENNVVMILEAFLHNNKKLKFVGNWDSSEFGRSLKDQYDKIDNIELIDPIYDLDELYKLRRGCSYYLHGHSAGGTNPSLVEMMHFGIPIFAFDCDFNRYSTEEKAIYFDSSESLKVQLEEASLNSLQYSANEMREIAQRRYTWAEVTKDYEHTYR